MKWFGLAALFGCSSTVKNGSATSGPFEILWDVTESRSGAWFNNGGNFNAKQYTSWFSVKHRGKPVQADGKPACVLVNVGLQTSSREVQVYLNLADLPVNNALKLHLKA
ncbi:MAG: hypothetical protein IPM81_05040 [Saprospirales bacterium]|nr:hypothetical protein [Saprospirales bacterium]